MDFVIQLLEYAIHRVDDEKKSFWSLLEGHCKECNADGYIEKPFDIMN